MPGSPCFVCGATEGSPFFEVSGVPVHCNLLWSTREDALGAPRADLRLVLCPSCGLIYNDRFEPERMRYVEGYETSLHHSATFQAYAEGLARRLVEERGIRDKDVVEIGCGGGDFLRLVCELGANRGIGIDPSHAGEDLELEGGARVRIVAETFSATWAGGPADLVLCRHVLEHLDEPLALLRSIREAPRGGVQTLVLFEVPNALYTLREGGIWDLIYEHCSYFVPASLEAAFLRAGMRPLAVEEAFGGQFLTIEARPDAPEEPAGPPSGIEALRSLTEAFAALHRDKLATWGETLADLRRVGRKAAVWGAGSKGVTFLNHLGADDETVSHVVDQNPRKQGRFVPGTGQRIVPPAELRASPPDVVVVINPVYTEEIEATLGALGLHPELLPA